MRYIQAYLGIIQVYSGKPCVILVYLEPWSIQSQEVPYFLDFTGFYLFFVFLVQFLFEGSFYLPQFSVGNSSDGTV